jgi:hypothetical protein
MHWLQGGGKIGVKMMNFRMLIGLVAAALTVCQSTGAFAMCRAEPGSPSCSDKGTCVGPQVIEGSNHMDFSYSNKSISLCEATMCWEGKVKFLRKLGNIEFVSGVVKVINHEKGKPHGPPFFVSAMLNLDTGIAHVDWEGRGIMMTCGE